jgi:hypothetical protein
MEEHGVRKSGYKGAEGKVVYLPDRGPVKHTMEESWAESALLAHT